MTITSAGYIIQTFIERGYMRGGYCAWPCTHDVQYTSEQTLLCGRHCNLVTSLLFLLMVVIVVNDNWFSTDHCQSLLFILVLLYVVVDTTLHR